MVFYIARRLVWTLVVVLCVLAITFAVFYLLPAGDPALRFAGKNPTDQEIAQIHQRLGLDQPWYVQFGKFSWRFASGDKYGWPGLGYTYASGSSVKALINARAPRTLLLIAGASILWLVLGVAIGVLSAVKRRSPTDRLAMGFALFGISTPVFWLGLMALFIFWQKLGWIGGTGYVSPVDSPTGLLLAHDPALDRARAALRRVLRADDPQQPARDARRGLHPNRAGEGAVGAHGDLQARPARVA